MAFEDRPVLRPGEWMLLDLADRQIARGRTSFRADVGICRFGTIGASSGLETAASQPSEEEFDMNAKTCGLSLLLSLALLLVPAAVVAQDEEDPLAEHAEMERQQWEQQSDAEDEALDRAAISDATDGAVSEAELEASAAQPEESQETAEPDE